MKVTLCDRWFFVKRLMTPKNSPFSNRIELIDEGKIAFFPLTIFDAIA